MREESAFGTVSLLLVSHREEIAVGTAKLVQELAGRPIRVIGVGAPAERASGAIGQLVFEALGGLLRIPGGGVAVVADIGSSVLIVRASIAALSEREREMVALADAPFVEGAVAAGVAASTGGCLEIVVRAAEEARGMKKMSRLAP